MLLRASLLPALAATMALLGSAAPPGAATAAPPVSRATVHAVAPADLPLVVTMETLSPSVVPDSGRLEVTGSVTNTTSEEWRVVRMYALTSAAPITSSDELAAAVRTDPAVQVGERITVPGSYDEILALAPGESRSYSLRVRRADLSIGTSPGIYWLGVHALGETDAGRDTLADGKARTFLPLVDDTRGTIDTALVVPVRRAAQHAEDGAVEDVAGWVADLMGGGRLSDVAVFGGASGARPVTWLVDPSVPDVVSALTTGNPARSLGPTVPGADGGEDPADPGEDPAEDGGEDPAESPAPDEATTGSGSDQGDPGTALDRAAARVGASWLARSTRAMAADEVLALPYGDLDVEGAAAADPAFLELARERSGRRIPQLRARTRPVVATPTGFLDESALALVPSSTVVLVSDRMVGIGSPALALVDGRLVVVSSSRAVAGGAGPGARFSPVAVRQRLLSEAALALLDGRDTLVAAFPAGWDPPTTVRTARAFFAGLDVEWLRLTTLRRITVDPGALIEDVEGRTPRVMAQRDLPASSFEAARALIASGERLDAVLPRNDTLARQVTDEAMTTVSTWVQPAPATALVAARESTAWIETRLHRLTLEPPASVTLSSDTGKFSATVTNGLDEPVRVRVVARTDAQLDIPPSAPLDLGPGEQATVLMEARSSLLGVHRVELLIADEEGNPVGPTTSFPLRAAEVSNVIWVVIGGGAVLLFGAIGVRLFRRFRGHLARGRSEA